jgi:hypothetical protein
MDMMMGKSLALAIDFDGTVVEHKFPAIGKEMPFAFATLKELQKRGHRLIMWTYRHGKNLDDAVEYCRKNGIPEEQFDPNEASRKLDCDMFIDDRNVGGFLGWGEIFNIIHPEAGSQQGQQVQKLEKKSFFGKLFGG